jgi:hypothetical protein
VRKPQYVRADESCPFMDKELDGCGYKQRLIEASPEYSVWATGLHNQLVGDS